MNLNFLKHPRIAWGGTLLACLGLLACNDGKRTAAPVQTAHVLPLQRVSLAGIAPTDLSEGFIRYEGEHFVYEVPVSATEPLTATAPFYIAKDGGFGSGVVHVWWVPSAGGEGPAVFLNREERPTRSEDAVDLRLDLVVGALPRFAYIGEPGTLVRAFTAGNLKTLDGAYGALFESHAGASARAHYDSQRQEHGAALRAALAGLDRVRATRTTEPLGKVELADGAVDAVLSTRALQLADQLVAAFLLAERSGTWTRDGVAATKHALGLAQQALSLDFESEASDWFPSMTDELASSVLEHASSLASFVSHATAAVAIAGTLGVVSATAVTATAVVGAVAYCALTYAPAATATVIRAAGNLVRGNGSLEGYEYETAAPGFKHIVSQNLSYALGTLEDTFAPWVNTGTKTGDALGRIATTLSGWTDKSANGAANWLVDCIGDRTMCLPAQGDDGIPEPADVGESVGQCNEAQLAGGDTPETRTFDVGTNCGDLTLQYETFSIEDAITVEYEGAVVASTGCVGANAALPIHICGVSSQVSVSVEPNCAGGTSTSWQFTLLCPSGP